MQTIAGSRARPNRSKFELYTWLFMRASGLLLLFLALGHFAIMHLINGVDAIDYDFVAARYVKSYWRAYDIALLSLALIHGLNGARMLTGDYLKDKYRRTSNIFIYLVAAVFIILGAMVIIKFKPQ